jgi:TPR repeat protein
MYELGLGSAINLVQAYRWYEAAIADAHPATRDNAQRALALLKARMKPPELAAAERAH